jgi:hypothetical protein
MFNNERRAAQIIKMDKNEIWLIAGFHAKGGSSRDKWEEASEFLDDINNQYIHPKIIYLDIN